MNEATNGFSRVVEYKGWLVIDPVPTAGSPTTESKSLPSYIPFQKTQASVREINKRRDRGERAAGRLFNPGNCSSASLFFSRLVTLPALMEAGILIGGWLLGSFLTYGFASPC